MRRIVLLIFLVGTALAACQLPVAVPVAPAPADTAIAPGSVGLVYLAGPEASVTPSPADEIEASEGSGGEARDVVTPTKQTAEETSEPTPGILSAVASLAPSATPIPPTATATSAPPTLTPTPSPTCQYAMAYVRDVTVPDGTRYQPGSTFLKTWEVLNAGTCPWEEGGALTHVGGDAMGAAGPVALVQVEPNERVQVSVELTAPETPGGHVGKWQVCTGAGCYEGLVTVVIETIGSSPAGMPFGYGIQAAMVYDTNHSRTFSHIDALRFSWVKQQVEWFRYNRAPGQYEWGPLDRIVEAAYANGVNVLFSVVKAPRWARPAGDTDEGPPADPNSYGVFLREMAARYKGRVKAYEIWNEQNLYYEWGGRGGKINAGKYVQLLQVAYNAIKWVDPDAVVVSGGLTPTGWNDGDVAVDDRVYLERMYQAGLARYCDAIGAHPSGYNNPPDADWRTWSDATAPNSKGHPSWFFRGTMESYRNIMVKYGDGHKRIWPTEFGWATVEGLGVPPASGYGYAAENTELEQAQFIVRAFQMGKAWGWVGPMFLWNLNFAPVSGNSNEKAAFGIVRQDWSPRPAFAALRDMRK